MEIFVNLPLVAIDDKKSTASPNKNPRYFEGVRALTAAETANTNLYSGANAVVEIRNMDSLPASEKVKKYYTTASVATVLAAAASALGASYKGSAVLVAGTKAISVPGVTAANNVAFVQLQSPSGASSTVQYKAVVTTDTVTITALVAAGTINTSDVSTVGYVVN